MLIELSVIFGLYVIGSLALMYHKDKTAQEERSELEDRLMALSKPDAIILHKAARDGQPAGVSYVGEGTAYDPEENGHLDLEGENE